MRSGYQNETSRINSIAIVLPLPPSANKWNTRTKRTKRTVTKKESREYRKSVQALVQHTLARAVLEGKTADCWPLRGPFRFEVDVYFTNRCGDLDNRWKFLLDCLAGLLYLNDNQLVSFASTRQLDKLNPRVRLRVSATTTDQVPLVPCPSPTPSSTPT
jgi:Holliday junction resolvase RusA-like endonuclease